MNAPETPMNGFVDTAVYGPRVLERFEAPVHAGVPERANRVGNAVSKPRASRVSVHLRIAGQAVEAAGFVALGCPHTIAAADLVCADLAGRTLRELRDYNAQFLDAALPLPAEKRDIRILLEDAVRNAAAGAG
jgi:NifU-like protein involved in Fe-S cluster formation